MNRCPTQARHFQVLERVRKLAEGKPCDIVPLRTQKQLSKLNWFQRRLVAVALQSRSATATELSEWAGCDLKTILAIGAAPEFNLAGRLE